MPYIMQATDDSHEPAEFGQKQVGIARDRQKTRPVGGGAFLHVGEMAVDEKRGTP